MFPYFLPCLFLDLYIYIYLYIYICAPCHVYVFRSTYLDAMPSACYSFMSLVMHFSCVLALG